MVYIHSDLSDTSVFSELFVAAPESGSKKNLLHMTILKGRCNETFYFRTPKLKFDIVEKDGLINCDLLFQGKKQKSVDKLYSFIKSLEDHLYPLISQRLKEMSDSIETINMFRSCILTPNTLTTPLHFNAYVDPGSKLFSESNTETKFSESNSYDYGTFIIACDNIMVTPTSAELYLRVVQGKIYSKTKKTEFGILDDEYKPEYKQFSLAPKEMKEESQEKKITIQLDN